MKHSKIINVTQKDIDDALNKPSNGAYCTSCPIARALRRTFHCSYKEVWAGVFELKVKNRVMPLTPEIVKFMQKFDSERVASPFSFEFIWED